MSKNVLYGFRPNFLFVLGVVLLLPLTQVSAGVVWEEDWETGPFDEWVFQGYFYNEVLKFQPNASSDPTAADGVFQTSSPSDVFGEYWSGAVRNSTIASGTWSFDWMNEAGVDHESYVNIFFLINNYPENLTDLPYEGDGNLTGYMLNLQSGTKGPLTAHSINIGRITGGGVTLGTKAYSTSITGSHHIDVTRTPEGQFNVYFDVTDSVATPIISVIDTTTTSFTQFAFGSWIGDSGIDNITVSNSIDITPDTTTTTTTTAKNGSGFEVTVFVLSLSLFFIITRKRRR
ncbi:MAG: hypothetical protein ACXACW_05135 [Candidatus Hodarchaeales archaeon]|jgi:hypothetical protein